MTKDRIAAAQLNIQRAQAAIEAGEYLVAADILSQASRKLRSVAEDERAERTMRQWGPKDQEVVSPPLPASRRTSGGRKRSDEGPNRRQRPAIARFSIGELSRRKLDPANYNNYDSNLPSDGQPAGHWPPSE
jgi:hypothetical protein